MLFSSAVGCFLRALRGSATHVYLTRVCIMDSLNFRHLFQLHTPSETPELALENS